jgi:hypothetical protein
LALPSKIKGGIMRYERIFLTLTLILASFYLFSQSADAVVFNYTDGSWWVALSTGKGFNINPIPWVKGFGNKPTQEKGMLADVNGDRKSDAVVFNYTDGSWWVALSTGKGFIINPIPWVKGFGNKPTQEKGMLADVNGDRKSDAVVFNYTDGSWWVALSTGKGFIINPIPWVKGFGNKPKQEKGMLADVNRQ